MSLKKYRETVCACKICKSMCKSAPCWPTPAEARKLIKAGYGDKLMLENRRNLFLLSPAMEYYEGKTAPLPFVEGRCVFLTTAGKCNLHKIGLKPVEGRLADCTNDAQDDLRTLVLKTWDNKTGQNLAANWMKERINENS